MSDNEITILLSAVVSAMFGLFLYLFMDGE